MVKKNTANRLLAAGCMMLAAAGVWAMPTKDALVQAQKLVEDLTADDVRAMKSGTKKPGEVAAAQLAMADEAETEAGKYLLLQGAFKLYARNADYDAAADVLARMRKEIADLPPELVVELVNGEMRRVAAGKAEKVMVIYRDARRTIRYRKELAAAEKAAAAKPSDVAIQRRVAECHAVLGDWAKALEAFAKIGVEAAKFELDPASAKGCDASKAADFWWNYPTRDSEPFQVHAAIIYRKGLADGSISGLRKTLAEKRVKQMESVLPAADEAPARGSGVPTDSGTRQDALYCVIDLSAGVTASRYPVMWLDKLPHDGFIMDEYRTNKLLLRRIPAGRDPLGRYSISSDFFIGVLEVTKCQWELVMGGTVMSQEDDARHPVVDISWQDIRGTASGKDKEGIYRVGPDSFAGKLAHKTGLKGLDLPSAAQWEYACRAGDDGDLQSDPNKWGLYNMSDSFWERCLDFNPELSGKDPMGRVDGRRCENCAGTTKRAGTNHCNPYRDRSFRICMSADQGVLAGREASRRSSDDRSAENSQNLSGQSSERPKDMSLTLRSGVTMDFVGCPAGSFMMGKPGDSDPKSATFEHKVTITRPFWMGKFPVTVEQWTSVMGRLNLSDAQKAMGPKMPVNMDRADVMTLALKLTRMNQNKLPKGYVIRLPSEAEWEYAVRANSTDPDDPYAWIRGGGRKFDGEWDKYRTSTKDILAFLKSKGIELSYNEEQKKRMARTGQPELPFWGKIFGCVGEHQPNAWGIHDVFHGQNVRETVLDTVSSSVQADFFRHDRMEYFFKDGDSDPLNYAGERKIHQIMLNDGPKKHTIGHPGILFRLVIGPDLLKERGIK